MSDRNYKGKDIFVGIDVHKKTYAIAVMCDKVLIKKDTLPACPEKLITYLSKFFLGANVKSAYEAGFSGFGLHRALIDHGINNIVVHAASIEIGARDRVKTDKRDALKIATQLEVGRLKGIYVPSSKEEARRALTHFRDKLVKERARLAATLKSKANYYGLIGPQDIKRVSKSWCEKLKQQEMLPEIKYVINELIKEWEHFSHRIKAVENHLKKQAAENEKYQKVYESVPGIGPTASRILANELGDMSRFPSERHLSSYTGLTPAEYSSGEHVRKGHISRQGNPRIRSILVVCSWISINYNKKLKEVYLRIARRAGSKKAIVAVARRLICQIRACFRSGTLYQIQPEGKAI